MQTKAKGGQCFDAVGWAIGVHACEKPAPGFPKGYVLWT